MPIVSPTITQLTQELVARVKTTKMFEDRAFSIFDMEDLGMKMDSQTTPAVAISYERGDPAGTPDQRRQVEARIKPSLLYLTVTFSILVGVEYNPTADEDTKETATDLLDQVRRCLLGYQGVNGKPWRFVSEQPAVAETRGVIWYGQLWQTDVPHESTLK